MEQRIKNLEDLCELITKEVVDQNKNMIDMNKNLINEIRALREAYVKQDEDFEEFKNLLRKIYELNRQNFVPPMFPPNMPPLGQPPHLPPHVQGPMNNSVLIDQINQSMLNNLSFQSVQTPLNQNQAPHFANLNQTMPASASAMMKQMPPDFSQPPPQVKPMANVQAPPFNLVQAPPSLFPTQPKPTQQQVQSQQQVPAQTQLAPQQQGPFKFAPSATTTSTPQPNQFAFKPTTQPATQQQVEKTKPPVFDFSPPKQVEQKPTVSQPAVKTPLFTVPPTTQITQQTPASNIFAGANLFKQSEPAKAAAPFSIPLGTNLFKLPTGSPSAVGPLLTGTKQFEEGDEGEGAGNPEEYEPQVEFKPIVQLKEVEVKTGEEDEDILLKQRCKLYRFDNETKEWKEKGLGELKLLKHRETKVIRVLMRREQVFKLCANHRVSGEMKLSEISPKQLSWVAIDFSENEAKTEMLLAKFRTPEEATQFRTEFEKSVKEMKILDASKSPVKAPAKPAVVSDKPSLSQVLKSDTWSCNGCYAPNKKDDLKCACCGTAKPGLTDAQVKSLDQQKPAASQPLFAPKTFTFGTQPQAQQQQQQQTPKFDFSAKENIFKTTSPSTPLFGTQPLITQPSTQQTFFDKQSMLSFSSLSASAKSGPIFGDTTASPIFKPNAFSGGIQASTQQAKPLFGIVPQAKAEEGEEEGVDNQNPEEYEPQVEFKPLVKLQEVEVKSGEESEESLFKERCKLYRYDSNLKEWKEKGTGEIKVLKHKTNENMFRILMRRDQVLKLCANHRITNDIKLEIVNDKQVRWYAQDYSEGEGKHELLAARFKREEDAKKFKQAVEDCQKVLIGDGTERKPEPKKEEATNSCEGLKPSLSAMFKQPLEQKEVEQVKAEPSKFSFGLPANQSQTPITFVQTFGQKQTTEASSKTEPEQKPEEAKPTESIFTAKPGLSFADLAVTNGGLGGGFTGGFKGGFGSQSNPPVSLFGTKATPLFGTQSGKTDEGEEEAGENHNPEEYEPQVEFKPLVKLHEVDVKSGEEDEEVLFKQRCKLFRFDSKTKEWKEKGTGDLKILKHKLKENSFRLLMRRDQVLKICANHRITPEINLESVNEKQLRWLANDCSEGEPQTEFLAVRFRGEVDAKKFKEEFEKCQMLSKASTGQKIQQPVQSVPSTKNDLANLIKTEQGSWNCAACLTLNKPNVVKCVCCDQDKPSVNDKNGQKDIEVVFTAKPNDEQIEKARSLGLPDSFYLYLNKPDCKGCIGCENEQ